MENAIEISYRALEENPEKRSKANPNRKFKRHGLNEEQYYELLNKCKLKVKIK